MSFDRLQQLCDLGQSQLSQTLYWEAELTLCEAESIALEERDFDTLARLYMPLQEARRQRRQRCGEGAVRLNLIADGPEARMEGRRVILENRWGQFLIAGWGSIAPAMEFRRLAREEKLYAETFLGAVYPSAGGRVVVVSAMDDAVMPPVREYGRAELERVLPEHSMILGLDEVEMDVTAGDARTFARVMGMWERLHGPFLAAARKEKDEMRKIEAYRRTIRVDYACELAHQELSKTARDLARRKRQ